MRTRSEAGRVALGVLLSLVVWVAPARAHDASSPLAVAVELERTGLAAVVRYSVERGEDARALREQFDRDADGSLDAAERVALRDFLAARARAALTIRLGEAPLVLETRSVDEDIEGDARVDARVAVVLRLVAEVSWPAGATTTLSIAAELPEARAITPVALRIGNASTGQLALVPADRAGGVASRGAPLVVEVRVVARSRRRRGSRLDPVRVRSGSGVVLTRQL
jgi:hypothetical protein